MFWPSMALGGVTILTTDEPDFIRLGRSHRSCGNWRIEIEVSI